jgi:uncharacterized protein (UPF0333 family)
MNRSTQRGAISGGLIAGLGFIGLIVIIALFTIMSYISAANYGNRMENQLLTKVENNQNIYANGTQKIIEIAQVPAMYVDDLTKVTQAAIGGRYGADGSKAVFQMLKEQNPQLDSSMYKKIQQVIESFRDEFQNNQTSMLDIRNTYKTALGTVWQGMWLKFAGYPKTDLSKFDIVTTDKAADAFKTHRDTGVQLRPAK